MLTTNQAALRLGVCSSLMRRWAPGIKGAVKMGGNWIIPEKSLERFAKVRGIALKTSEESLGSIADTA